MKEAPKAPEADLPPWEDAAPVPAAPTSVPAAPAPAETPAPPAGSAALSWPGLLRELEQSLFPPDYYILSNAANVEGSVQDGTVILYTKNDIAKDTLNQDTLAEIRKAARSICGSEVSVRAEPWREEQAAGSMADLSRLEDFFRN